MSVLCMLRRRVSVCCPYADWRLVVAVLWYNGSDLAAPSHGAGPSNGGDTYILLVMQKVFPEEVSVAIA